MASLPPFSRRAASRPGRWGWAAIAIAVALALRLAPLSGPLALDNGAAENEFAPPAPNPAEAPGENFPGSAYFFVQDAFAPVDVRPAGSDTPGVTTLSPDANSPHVLQIERGSPVALSMPMRGATILDQARALQCLTNAIYYEAGNEPEEGQRAVAQVILNRIASGRWPSSVCGVVYQGTERADRLCQFTFSCDGSMARIADAASWSRARRIAGRALAGETFAPAGLATFYHTLAVHPPWSGSVRPVAVIGAHIFYRLPGEAGAPAAYRMRYSGSEFARPGPYAFIPPPRAVPAPPGPDALGNWMIPPILPYATSGQATTSAASSPLLPQPSPAAGGISRAPSFSPFSTPQSDPPRAHTPGSPDLPQSTIRPEYRNSGRPLR